MSYLASSFISYHTQNRCCRRRRCWCCCCCCCCRCPVSFHRHLPDSKSANIQQGLQELGQACREKGRVAAAGRDEGGKSTRARQPTLDWRGGACLQSGRRDGGGEQRRRGRIEEEMDRGILMVCWVVGLKLTIFLKQCADVADQIMWCRLSPQPDQQRWLGFSQRVGQYTNGVKYGLEAGLGQLIF